MRWLVIFAGGNSSAICWQYNALFSGRVLTSWELLTISAVFMLLWMIILPPWKAE